MKSNILVTIQFLAFGYLGLTSLNHEVSAASVILMLVGVFIGLWAIISMQATRFSIKPDVQKDAILITDGPYNYIRHPMYAGLLVFATGLLAIDNSPFRLVVFLILLANQIYKMEYEEQLLEQHFPEYIEYTQKTARLLPPFY